MAQIDDEIKKLQDQVAAQTTVEESAETLLAGIPKLISDAVAKAQAAGATPAQLQAITDVTAQLAASQAKLVEAVTDNTPAAG